MKRIAILGSTGSVGMSALELIAERPESFAVAALTARSRFEDLRAQVRRFRPAAACLVDAEERDPKSPSVAWFHGADGILEALETARPDLVLNAITGAAGLPASEWALRQGVPLALANKESLVCAGSYLTRLAAETATPILPVDSEHCAIFQCLRGEDPATVRRIYLTASGGPFRERAPETLADVTVEEALCHPTWDMGPRITIGSATMMNKAFEVVEAHWLFGLEAERIRVLVHPQSIVHSMVEFHDGSILAQLGVPDMRVPILYCLTHPDREPFSFEPFDPTRFSSLGFEPIDSERFPAIRLAYRVLEAKGDSGAVLNAADEVLTELFLAGRISFPRIVSGVAAVLEAHDPREIRDLEDVRRADRWARQAARAFAAGEEPSPRDDGTPDGDERDP